MDLRSPVRPALAALLLIGSLGGCSRAAGDQAVAPDPPAPTATVAPTPTATPQPSPTPMPSLGSALESPRRPTDEACDRLQRHDRVAALNMRQGVDLRLSGIGTDLAAVDAAIEDPASDIELIGIPLRPAEVEILTSSGMYLNEEAPIAFWTYDGRPDLFGAHWIDPPGSHRHVVSIVDGNEDTLKLARCLERNGLDIRYVTALRSRAELLALADRVVSDWDALRDEGIEIVSAGQRSSENTVSIGVEGLTDEIAATLRERYGQHVIVKEDSAGQLDGG